MDNKSFCIVICAYNEEKYIENCLKSIYKLREISTNFCAYVINDGSEDSTSKKTSDFIKKNKTSYINIVNLKHGGLSVARNKGIEIALSNNYDYIIFIDADAEIDDKYLTNLSSHCNDLDEIDVFGGDVLNHHDTGGENNIYYHLYFKKYRQKRFVIGTNMVFKVKNLKNKKFFKVFDARGDENTFIDYYGLRNKFLHDLKVNHRHCESFNNYIKLRGKNGDSFATTNILFRKLKFKNNSMKISHYVSFSILLFPVLPIHIILTFYRIFNDKLKWKSILNRFGYFVFLKAVLIEYLALMNRDFNYLNKYYIKS